MNEQEIRELREGMEVRIVAVLLGEASAFETAEIEQAMQREPELAAFHAEMRRTIDLTREASKQLQAPSQPAAEQPKLSPERREALLARFKQPKVVAVPVPRPARRLRRWLVPASLAAGFVVLAIAVSVPSFHRARTSATMTALSPVPVSQVDVLSSGKELELMLPTGGHRETPAADAGQLGVGPSTHERQPTIPGPNLSFDPYWKEQGLVPKKSSDSGIAAPTTTTVTVSPDQKNSPSVQAQSVSSRIVDEMVSAAPAKPQIAPQAVPAPRVYLPQSQSSSQPEFGSKQPEPDANGQPSSPKVLLTGITSMFGTPRALLEINGDGVSEPRLQAHLVSPPGPVILSTPMGEAEAAKAAGKSSERPQQIAGEGIAFGEQKQRVQLWDVQTGKPLTEPLKHGAGVNSAAFTPDGRQIATTPNDSSSRLWAENGRGFLDGAVEGDDGRAKSSADLSPEQLTTDGRRVVTLDVANPDRVQEMLEKKFGRELSRNQSKLNGAEKNLLARGGDASSFGGRGGGGFGGGLQGGIAGGVAGLGYEAERTVRLRNAGDSAALSFEKPPTSPGLTAPKELFANGAQISPGTTANIWGLGSKPEENSEKMPQLGDRAIAGRFFRARSAELDGDSPKDGSEAEKLAEINRAGQKPANDFYFGGIGGVGGPSQALGLNQPPNQQAASSYILAPIIPRSSSAAGSGRSSFGERLNSIVNRAATGTDDQLAFKPADQEKNQQAITPANDNVLSVKIVGYVNLTNKLEAPLPVLQATTESQPPVDAPPSRRAAKQAKLPVPGAEQAAAEFRLSDQVQNESKPKVMQIDQKASIANAKESREKQITSKLDAIRLDHFQADGLPLAEVMKSLNDQAKQRDPDNRGVRIGVNLEDNLANATASINPSTGLPPLTSGELPYLASTTIHLKTPLTNVTLREALEAVQKVADRPIQYSVEDSGVRFSWKTPDYKAKEGAETTKATVSVPPTPLNKDVKLSQPVEDLQKIEDRPGIAYRTPAPTPQPEITTGENAFSTFSLNVSDVSFKLAVASLENNTMPDPASIRVEEFVNAFNYHDPAPQGSARLAFAWERARYPFAHNRDILRFAIQTAARGREPQKPLNLVVVLDNSGSMERPDRVQIVHKALNVLAQRLQPQDRISVVAFARTARLWVDGMAGGKPKEFLEKVLELNPDGGTNLEDALGVGYATAARHFMADGINRVILLTDGAANLGSVEPEALKQKVVANRIKGIALDCFGIGWEGYNDDLLEVLSHNGDGRYGFLDHPEEAAPEFANQLAGALNVAAADVKTQVEFNLGRVLNWRQIGYAKHQITKEQFRDNTVDAAELAAAESGNALYAVQVNPEGSGPLGVVRVRYKIPANGQYVEQAWTIPYQPRVAALGEASPAMRLAVTAAAFGEWLSRSPYAGEVTPAALQPYLNGVSETYAPDPRPQRLGAMIRQAQALTGK